MEANTQKTVDFKETRACALIKDFIFQIDNSIKTDKQEICVDSFLQQIKSVIENQGLSSEPTRFANAAMKCVILRVAEISDDEYLQNSFGNAVRMDFGTGHELNFLCYLYRLVKRNLIPVCGVFSILQEYFVVVREYIDKFNVEAAGARGCWSVDDYLLLPYVFGSSENFSKSESIDNIESGTFKEAYMHKQVNGMLEGISKLSWKNINIGLLKMYDEEVLGRRVVTQHFIYSLELPL